jgi:hypothetical protein
MVKARRYGLQVTLDERAEVIARKTQEMGCFVLLTNVPTAGEMAHRAGDVLIGGRPWWGRSVSPPASAHGPLRIHMRVMCQRGAERQA